MDSFHKNFNCSTMFNYGAIDVKMGGLEPAEKKSFTRTEIP